MSVREAVLNVPSVDNIRADMGPLQVHYRRPLDRAGGFYKWVQGSVLADDGRAVIVPLGGGLGGAWIRQVEDDRGTDLADASVTLTVGGGAWRVLPAATLTANRTLTLSTTNAQAGDRIAVTRLDASAHTVAIVNGGVGAGTLCTLPASSVGYVAAQFDGVDWAIRESGLFAVASTGSLPARTIVRITNASSATVLASWDRAMVDVSGGAPPSITMPPSPSDGDVVSVTEDAGSFGTTPCPVTANAGQDIEDPNTPGTYAGIAGTVSATADGASLDWMWSATPARWKLI